MELTDDQCRIMELRDRLTDLQTQLDQLRAAQADLRVIANEAVERLRASLPESMEGCTIRFIECPLGHGRLTATNWVPTGCLACELTAGNALLAEVRDWHGPHGLTRAFMRRLTAHLAGQPATVTRPASDGTQVECHPDFARSYDAAPGLWQGTLDAAAIEAEYVNPFAEARGIPPEAPVPAGRTEAEQRVLDAMGLVSNGQLKNASMGDSLPRSTQLITLAVAELARRGLKP